MLDHQFSDRCVVDFDPSCQGNGKVLKIGSKVKVLKSFEAFRMETSRTKALAVFPQSLPEGLSGTCVFLHSIGNAPTSGPGSHWITWQPQII